MGQNTLRHTLLIYGRECYGFRCLASEQQTDFILARLDYGKFRDVIHFATDTKARMVLLGDFHNTASSFAIYPDVIVFVITMTTDIGPKYRSHGHRSKDTNARSPSTSHILKRLGYAGVA